MKTILSVCMLTGLLYSCTKNDKKPLDCSGIENGTAITDDCGDCHKWTVYNKVTHAVTEVDDTINAVLGATEMFTSPNNPMNPAWNFCPDCTGFSNGVAVIDSCGDCQEAYIYNMVTHDPSEIVMLGGDTTGVSVTLTAGQVIILPENPENPYWNSGCE